MSIALSQLPVKNPVPDAGRFIDVLMGRVRDVPPPLIEYLVDEVVRKPIVTKLLGQTWVEPDGDRASQSAYLDRFIEFWYRLGYDFVRFEQGLGFAVNRIAAPDTAPGSGKLRAWADEHQGRIQSWDDFGSYPWPQVKDMDFFAFEYLDNHLPEGMGLMTCHAAGVFEHVSQIMSLEGLCLALYDDPGLVRAVADKVGELMLQFYRHLLDLERVVAIFQGDDMGFRTATLISPADLRTYILPWHKRLAALAHQRGLPYFLHSCGNLGWIMQDLIQEVEIDGKHSFEDAIVPVEAFHDAYSDKIAALGGVDVDILAASTPDRVRGRTRALMEKCGQRGRYAIGSGNSIPSYVPVENYLAMVDEALAYQAAFA